MDVAVAQMPEGGGARAGEAPLGLGRGRDHEARHLVDGHRDVVLHRRAERALGLRDRIADVPEGLDLRLARRDHRVLGQPGLEHRDEKALQQRGRRLGARFGRHRSGSARARACSPASGERVPGM